jgi:hypothetical protein
VLHYSDDRQKPDFSVIRTQKECQFSTVSTWIGGPICRRQKGKAYLKKWNIRDASRASLIAIELTLGPEAQRLCTQLADLTGEGPEESQAEPNCTNSGCCVLMGRVVWPSFWHGVKLLDRYLNDLDDE